MRLAACADDYHEIRETPMRVARTTHRIVAALAVAMLAACSGASYDTGPTIPPAGDGHTVTATSSLTFTPSTLSIATGQTVSFAFGAVAHNVLASESRSILGAGPDAIAETIRTRNARYQEVLRG